MQKIKSFLIWLPAVIWYGLIFLLSAQPAYKSEAVSDTVTGNALSAGGSGYVNAEVIVQESVEELLSLFVRKGAHMFLFFVLAILVWLALVRLIHNRHHRAAVTIVICILLAAFDELHQKSVPGRSGELRDIMVDGAGVLIAMILFTMPALSKWLRSHIAHPAVLLTAGVICGGLLLIWSGTLDRMPQAFMHRTTQVDYFASMEKGERESILINSAPIIRQALYLAACVLIGFCNTFLACLAANKREVIVMLVISVLMCCATGLIWTGLPVFVGVLLALIAGMAAVGVKKCFPLLKY